jgi:hypothetical protein
MIGFFEESEGNKSMTRLMSFIFGLYAIVSSGWVFYKGDYGDAIATFSAIAGLAIGAKLIQKANEAK